MEDHPLAISDDRNVPPWKGIASLTSSKANFGNASRICNIALVIRVPNVEKASVVSPVLWKEDGSVVKLFEPNIRANSKKLLSYIVVKVFGCRILIHLIAVELRRQWTKFGKFHLTSLGSDWVLCSFFSNDAMENVLSGDPWFVNGHIIGLDKWNSDLNPNSLKGLSSPIWIRMPSLPLYCWDEINVSRIASSIGEPILIDGDMFQWERREFSRICVHIQLDQKLPTGVW
ncbi:uncharacterized protein LOC110093265, partial [Dendrobium catenatum]|uniref:uncharacterized protein LOC110093265 n=1 Tax=Dendrobium catenatum TaxID=906689 RepID=UPI0009F58132